jgi:predicted ATP-dependent endonuclease of OLD family
MIKKIRIQNFKSIVDTTIEFNDLIYVLAGQNESGKSSILEAIHAFEENIIDRENLNFDEESNGNTKQSISITYNTNEELFNYFEKECTKLVDENKLKSISNFKLFDNEKLSKLKEFTLIRSIDFEDKNQTEFSLEINQQAFNIIKVSIYSQPHQSDDTLTKIVKILIPHINLDNNKKTIIENLWKSCPSIVYFDSVADLLPDEVYIDKLNEKNSGQKGLKAVKNFENIIDIDFISLSKKSQALKRGSIEKINKSITATFQKDWRQKISGNNQVEICFELSYDESGKEKVSFFIKSKDGVYLQPRRRSKGLIWFLSLWLELKASESLSGIVFLFDEPGQNLHVKACSDMLEVFNNLSKSGHQIIYSTHSPSLIEIDKLHNIGLVINTEREGTIVEGLTTSKVDTTYKKDALQPISEAMGLEPLKEFSILSQKNIIIEGLSDFWYYKGMSKILKRQHDYKFVPGIGVKSTKLYPLISFCIGYGLDWILIMENGENPLQTKKELLESVFFNNDDEINNKVKIIDFKEVEDMFTLSDFNLLDSKININTNKTPSEIIGKRKIIFSGTFFSSVERGKITKSSLDPKTISNFEKIFDFIDNKLFNKKS